MSTDTITLRPAWIELGDADTEVLHFQGEERLTGWLPGVIAVVGGRAADQLRRYGWRLWWWWYLHVVMVENRLRTRAHWARRRYRIRGRHRRQSGVMSTYDEYGGVCRWTREVAREWDYRPGYDEAWTYEMVCWQLYWREMPT
jgi:hypothetical protein